MLIQVIECSSSETCVNQCVAKTVDVFETVEPEQALAVITIIHGIYRICW
jgi:hypothetical protein